MSYNGPSTDNTSQILGQNILGVGLDDDIQTAIDALSALGGGIINLSPGQYDLTDDLVVPSNITINGNGAVLDFGGGAFTVSVVGANPYNTGTASIAFGSDTVTGAGGATWDAGMVGQSILLGDFWYEIADVPDPATITLASTFLGTSLTNDTYVIADTVTGITFNSLTVQNSTVSLITGRYIDGMNLNSVNTFTGDIGFDFQDAAAVLMNGFFTDACTTWGVKMSNCPYATLQTFSVLSAGMSLTRVSNTGISIASYQALTTVALQLTNCYNIGIINYAIIEGTSHGIEFVSGNSDIDVGSGYINSVGGDGIKLTATSDRITLGSTSILNTTGKQINIAAGSCDDNTIIGNQLDGSGTGAVNDSGTGTLIRSNQGVADN